MAALVDAERALNVSAKADWYPVSYEQLRKAHPASASMLANQYNCSLPTALMRLFPAHIWHPWKFNRLPSGWWIKSENRSSYLDWLQKELGVVEMKDWYSVSYLQIQKRHGRTLFKHFHSLYDILKAAHPDHMFLPWRFATTPRKWWSEKGNQRQFLEHCLIAAGFSPSDLSAWHTFKRGLVDQNGGSPMLHHYYGDSLAVCLKTVYPDHSWNQALLSRTESKVVPVEFIPDSRRQLVEKAAKLLGVSEPEDWYRVTQQSLRQHGPQTAHLAVSVPKRIALLSTVYPKHSWEAWRFRRPSSRSKSATIDSTPS